MIRPIDTQILHPQTPELASRQHTSNQLPGVQQEQFAHIMQKEVQHKKDTVIETSKTEGLKTNEDNNKKPKDHSRESKKRNSFRGKPGEEPTSEKDIKGTHKIDVRI